MNFLEIIKKYYDIDVLLNEVIEDIEQSEETDVEDPILKKRDTRREKIEYVLRALPLTKGLEHKEELFKKRVGGYTRRDLLLSQLGILEAQKDYKELLKMYKPYLNKYYYNALRLAYAVIDFEDHNDSRSAGRIYKDLLDRHNGYGKHIYNYARSGLFEDEFLFEYQYMKIEGYEGEVLKLKFTNYLKEQIEFYPFAIWIDKLMNENDLLSEIKKRFELEKPKVDALTIYARKKNKINLLKNLVTEYVEMNENLIIKSRKRYQICYNPCMSITIRRVS